MPLQPNEINQLNAIAFHTNIQRLPNVNYFCQRIDIPSVNLGIAPQVTPFSDAPTEGDKLTFEQFTMTFIVSEDISNYLEIYNWMVAIGFPDSHKQFTLKTSSLGNTSVREPQTIKSDMSVIITTNKSNPNFNITFKDAFPVSLGNISLDAATASLEPILVDATFEYVGSFSIEKFN